MNSRSAIKLLLGTSVGLPLSQTLLYWIGGLLRAMGDQAGADFCSRLQTVAGALWLISLVGLVILLAVQAVNENEQRREE